MNVVELYNLAKWVEAEVEDANLLNQYSELYVLFKQNSNRFRVLFEKEKNTLIETLKGINIKNLTKDQEAFLNELEISFAIGLQGVKPIEDILFLNQVNIETADQEFKRIINPLTAGISRMTDISNGLRGRVQDEIGEYQDEVLIRVGFLDNASMSNIEDFKKWGEEWYKIGYGIAMAHGVKPQDIKIVGATRGSVILDIIASHPITITMGSIVFLSLTVTNKILNITKAIQQIKKIGLEAELLKRNISDLEDTAKKEKEDGINNIAALQIKKLGLKKNIDGDKIAALVWSITALFDFNEQGGEVNFIPPKQEANSDEKDAFAEIRKIANDIKALEDEAKLTKHQISNDNQKKLT